MAAIIGSIIAGISLMWQWVVSLMGRTAVIAKPSPTCDMAFHEFNRVPQRIWRVQIYMRPPNDVIIRNAVGLEYRFEAKLIRYDYGSQIILEGWNKGGKDKRHKSPIVLNHEDIPPRWVSSNTSDWFVEAWITVGSKRRTTLYRGHPTGSIQLTRDN